jgi:hypothetical protein
VTLSDEAEFVTAIRTTHKIRGDPVTPLFLHADPHTVLTIDSSLSPSPVGFAFNPVSVTRTMKTNSSSGALIGDRALISLVNNTLEIYHINSPDSVPAPVQVIPSTPSSSSAKKGGKEKGKSAKAKEDGADEDDEGEEEEVVAIELIQSSRGELVLKQAVIDHHGHRQGHSHSSSSYAHAHAHTGTRNHLAHPVIIIVIVIVTITPLLISLLSLSV